METGVETDKIVPDMCYAAGRWRTPAYPIAAFVEAAMVRCGQTRGSLAAALGYRNTAKGLRYLDLLVEGYDVPPAFLQRFVPALDIDWNDFNAAVEVTRTVQREAARQRQAAELAAARATFRPHLRALTERTKPQPIFVVALTGTAVWLRASVPEKVLALPLNQQRAAVGDIARVHYAKRNGRAGPFGAITGYLFRPEFEKAIWLDVEGMVQGDYRGAVSDGWAYLTVE